MYDTKRRRNNIIAISDITSVSENSPRTIIDFILYMEVSLWLAWYHVVTHSTVIIDMLSSDVYQRLAACSSTVDFQLTMRDSQFSATNAARQVFEAYNVVEEDITAPSNSSVLETLEQIYRSKQITTLLTPLRSVECSAVNYLASAYDLAQMGSTATATYLNNEDVYPTFARTIPTNAGDASTMVLYITQHFKDISHVAVVYIGDGYGNDFHADLVRDMVSANISVLSIQYEDTTIENAVQELASSNLRYIIALLNPGPWRDFVRVAYDYQIIGRPDYFWIFSETLNEITNPSFRANSETEAYLAAALHGSAVVSANEPTNEIFLQEVENFSKNETLQQMFIDQHDEPDLFTNYTFPIPGPGLYSYLTYDAALALMLATCDTLDRNNESNVDQPADTTISGRVIYKQMLRTEFLGVSGLVRFDPSTGTRESNSFLYGIRNVVLVPDHPLEDGYRFTSVVTSVINLEQKHLDIMHPFVYFSNSTVPPLPLPPVESNLNLIPTSILVFGWSLCGLVVMLSIFWNCWTLVNRNKDVVKASQPIFLCEICIGTFIIALAIIPMSLQEPLHQHGLDIACMAAPWLLSVGFVTAFSALFTKTWRLNILFRHGRSLRRIVVRPVDVAVPFLLLMILNFVVMLAWTIDAPLIWERSNVASYDTFGRSIESVGQCVSSNPQRSTIYMCLIGAINTSVLVFAIYQAYLARNLSSEFSESTYIAIALASLFEMFALGIPLLFLSSADPTVVFLIRSLLTSVTCLSILIPIFLPKFLKRTTRQRVSKIHRSLHGTEPTSQMRIRVSSQNVSNVSGASCAALPGDDPDTPSKQKDDSSPTSSPSKRGLLKVNRSDEFYLELSSRNLVDGESQERRKKVNFW